ncbi:hypothetical protein ACWDYH_05815 [Nocardia goodfellowii]
MTSSRHLGEAGYFHCPPECELGAHEVVVHLTGTPGQREAVLEFAANYAGGNGLIHVVCDGMFQTALTGPIMLGGLIVGQEQYENADFAAVADRIAPFGCAWTWNWTCMGARWRATRLAKEIGAIMVLPRRSLSPFLPGVRIKLSALESQ